MEGEDKHKHNQQEIIVPTVDENGNPLSKNEIKKRQKAEKTRLEKLEKEKAKAEKAASQPQAPAKEKKVLLGPEITDPSAYYSNRVEVITKLKSDPNGPYFPYPHKWHTTHTVPEYVAEYSSICVENHHFFTDKSVAVAGRITSIREMSSKLIFYDLNAEGSKVQVYLNANLFPNEEVFETLVQLIKRGDIVGIKGQPGRTKTGELSIAPLEMRLLSPCLYMLPTERQGVKDPEIRYRQRYLDLICNKSTRDKFIIRNKVIKYVRSFLDNRGFMEVDTPVLNMQAGGATAKPFTTFHNSLKRDLTLRVAPELFLKQLIIGGFDRVYELGKQFRNEGIDQTHNPEFTSCEFYWAYADYEDLIDFTEEMLHGMVVEITGSEVVTIQNDKGENVDISFKRPWKRIPMLGELSKHLGVEIRTDNLETPEANAFFEEQAKKHNVDCAAPRTTARLIDKLVGHFIEVDLVNPTFLTEHPQLMCPLAKYHRSKPGLTERFELFINRHEYANAYTELNDPFLQRSLFEGQMDAKAQGDDEAQPIDEGFIKSMEHALPPTGGWGLGVDRLCMLLTNSLNIQEVILFPAMKPKENNPGEAGEITENKAAPVEGEASG